MVRRGSTVRVRQRASEKASKWPFLLPRRDHARSLRRPRPVPRICPQQRRRRPSLACTHGSHDVEHLLVREGVELRLLNRQQARAECSTGLASALLIALVLGLRPPLLLAPVNTGRRGKLSAKTPRRPRLPRSAEVPANRSHRRRRVVEFCRSGGGMWTGINDHLPLQSDSGLPMKTRECSTAWESRPIRRTGVGAVTDADARPFLQNSVAGTERACALRALLPRRGAS